MKKFLIGILIGVMSGIIVSIGVYHLNKWMDRRDPSKIIAYLPYANDYVDEKGRRYKDATPDPPSQMLRNVDQSDPVPLNIKKGEQKLTIGVRNVNPKTINNVKLFLEFPEEFIVTRYTPWMQYTDKHYSIPLGNINSGVGHNVIEPIFFKAKKTGPNKIIYSIVGNDFSKITRIITFDVYEE